MIYSDNGLPSLLLSYAHEESRISSLALNSSIGTDQNRVILEGNDFIAIVPFWASWPFETIILPKNRQISSIAKLTKEEIKDLANIISRVCIRMDNL